MNQTPDEMPGPAPHETNNETRNATPAADPTAYQQVPYTANPYAGGYAPGASGYVPGTVPPAPGHAFDGTNPRPVLAAFLGLIPGVGAIYNGQYAKGFAHIIIFAVLDSLKHASGLFDLLTFGWVCYQVFDAYHTAVARRDRRPLPDPLGLNNIGTIVGARVHRESPNPAAPWTAPVPPYAPVPPAPFTSADVPVPAQVVPGADPPAWSAAYAAQPYAAPYTPPAPAYPVPPASTWTDTHTGVEPGVNNTAAEVLAQTEAATQPSRFPSAAIWLIGFGCLFLLFNFIPDFHLNIHRIIPFILIAAGLGLLFKRLAQTGGITPRADEGDAYSLRLIDSLRAPLLIVAVGVLDIFEAFDVARFGRTWPVLIIVLGVALLLERSAAARVSNTLDNGGL